MRRAFLKDGRIVTLFDFETRNGAITRPYPRIDISIETYDVILQGFCFLSYLPLGIRFG